MMNYRLSAERAQFIELRQCLMGAAIEEGKRAGRRGIFP